MKYYYLPKIVQKNASDLLTLVIYRMAFKDFSYDPITQPILLQVSKFTSNEAISTLLYSLFILIDESVLEKKDIQKASICEKEPGKTLQLKKKSSGPYAFFVDLVPAKRDWGSSLSGDQPIDVFIFYAPEVRSSSLKIKEDDFN